MIDLPPPRTFAAMLSRYSPWRLRMFCLLFCFALASCGGSPTVTLPTAYVVRAGAAAPAWHTPTTAATATLPPLATPTSQPSPTALPGTPLEQYRAWIEQARVTHPYGEPVEVMWQVMLCESSGQPDQVSGIYYGLFQYQPDTWAGEWNPYRASPILDPHAQIFATAKAWQDGNQHWWGCYRQ
jgi:hypothetical protein